MKKLICLVGILLLFGGCASSIKHLSRDYAQSSQAVKEFAKISAQDWLFGSGIIQGALEEDNLPSWVFFELRMIDFWFEKNKELTEFQLGYIVGVRFRMASPIIRAAIEQYAPELLNIREVITVLSFLGI